jgi:hypothetical protein
MTLAPVINEGVSCLSFRHEDEEQVTYGYIGELLGYKKEARGKLMSKKKNARRIFWGNDFERRLQGIQNFYLSGFFGGRVHEARKIN